MNDSLFRKKGMHMDAKTWTRKVRQADNRRSDVPGEHWVALGAGLLLLWRAARGRSFIGRTLAGTAGSALVGRAASGRGGLERLVRTFTGTRR
jgi:hypothetical protein